MRLLSHFAGKARDMPERCHVVLPVLPAGGNVALCVHGEAGVRMTAISVGETAAARLVIRSFNASLGIDDATEFSMLVGCMLGWDRDLADPAFVRETDPRFCGRRTGVQVH